MGKWGEMMYKKANEGWFKYIDFIILDALCLQISFILAYFIRQEDFRPYRTFLYRNMAILLFMIQIIVTFFFDSFKDVLKRGYYKELIETLKHTSLVILFTVSYFFLTQTGELYSRIILLLTGTFYAFSSYLIRIFWKDHLKNSGLGNNGKRSLLIITSKDMAISVLNNVCNHNYEGFQINGIVIADADLTGNEIDGIPVVSNIGNVVNHVRRKWVDEVFINLPRDFSPLENTVDSFIEMGITVHQNLIDITALSEQKQRVERMGDYTVLTTCINMASSKQLFVKRIMDIAGGTIGCIIATFLYLVLAPCIYIHSPGPILFSQVRVGKNGKRFKIYKFRSMYMDAEKRKKELMTQNRIKDGMMFKMDHDPRIIGGESGIGSFMRNYSLDEWPQMWNVLKGDMSLVGTRPPTIDEWNKYEPHHRARLSIKPGLTGLWQVSGRSSITDFEEVVKLDKKYITEWNFKLDIKILLKTVGVVAYREGAL